MSIIPIWQAIESGDGFLASTLLLPRTSAEKPAPVVICCHGLTGTRIGSAYRYPRIGQRLAQAGIGCITFDFRGCGESGGRFIDLTPQSMRQDLQTVLRWLGSQHVCDVSRIGICASSFGAITTASITAALPSIAAIALWAPVAHPRPLIEAHLNDAAWAQLRQQGWLPHRGLRLGAAFFDQVVDENQDAAAQLAKANRPTLIFHGTGDSEVPFEHGVAYEAAMTKSEAPVRLEALDTDDHGMRDLAISDRLIEDTALWFENHLAPD